MKITTTLLLISILLLIPGAAKPPNIILVITDDQGYGPIGKHGHPWIKTPNLDQLYEESTRFTRFLVSATCSPTRAALMTGRHPLKNGVTHTILERERMTLNAKILPQILKQSNYTTGIFGKWHLGDEDPYQPHHRGFDEAFIHGAGGIGQAYNCSCADAPKNKYFNPIIRHNDTFVQTKGFCTNIFFDAALGWIKSQKESQKPFFAFLSTNAPHGPFIAPPKNVSRFTDLGFTKKHAGFYGMVENIDENMGRLLKKLNEWKLEENTILIFMSDNGMTFNGAGKAGQILGQTPSGKDLKNYNAQQKGFKVSPDEGGVRVPFFIRWKGTLPSNRDISNVTAHIDLLPTLAEIAKTTFPKSQVEGRSFLPLLKDPTSTWPDRFLFTQIGRWRLRDEPNHHQWNHFAVRNHRFRLVGNKLYDMINDPSQKNDIADKHPEEIKKMRAAYDQFWKEARPLMVNEKVKLSKSRPYHDLYNKQLKAQGIPNWIPPQLD